MPRREPERVEVVAGRLDLTAVDDLVAEPEEDVLDVAAHLCRRVERAAPARAERPPLAAGDQLGGQCDVDPLRRELRVELGALEPVLLRLDGVLDRYARRVERHAGLPVAYVAERELQRALAAEVANTRVVEIGERPGRGDGGERFVLECLSVHRGDCIGSMRTIPA